MNKTIQDILNSDWPLKLDPEFEGCCPCALIEGEGFVVDVHCWRGGCKDCEFSGVHVSGTISFEDKTKIAEHIIQNNGWTNSTDWNIVIT